jgi:hypothetical protein
MATDREVDRYRRQAEANLATAARLFDALMFAAKQLVGLTAMHQPDDFMHCVICKVPFPCPTADQVTELSQVFDKAIVTNQKKVNGDGS